MIIVIVINSRFNSSLKCDEQTSFIRINLSLEASLIHMDCQNPGFSISGTPSCNNDFVPGQSPTPHEDPSPSHHFHPPNSRPDMFLEQYPIPLLLPQYPQSKHWFHRSIWHNAQVHDFPEPHRPVSSRMAPCQIPLVVFHMCSSFFSSWSSKGGVYGESANDSLIRGADDLMGNEHHGCSRE